MGVFRRLLLKKRLISMGFTLKKDNEKKFWQKHIDDSKHKELKYVRKFCRRRLLKYCFKDDSMERSTNYRSNFFKNRKGVFGSNIYVCAYCGRFMTKKNVRVDHIIPVYKAKNYNFYKKLLSFQGIKNVNDARNLTASCEKCNQKKSAYGGLWIIRGWFGKSWLRVLLKEFIFLILGSILLYYLYSIITSYFQCDFMGILCEYLKYNL